jgi:hypothetical protein
MLSFTHADLIAIAERLLEMEPDPIPRFRLLRDVLCLGPSDPRYRQAKNALQESKWVIQLKEAQLSDGTWGRFHSRDSRLKTRFPTTELAISRALACGLDGGSRLLAQATRRIVEYADGRSTWPDPAEKHDNPLAWGVWVRHFSAAVLALLDPHHPSLEEFWQVWAGAVNASFQGGEYDREKEILVLNQLLNCRMKDPVPFHRKYPLLILSSTRNRLPAGLEQKLLRYVIRAPHGIYYVCNGPLCVFPPISSRNFWNWLQAHKLLSRFGAWKDSSLKAVNWVWAQRTKAGLWDLGPQFSTNPTTGLPLSETWKRPENRLIDSSVEVLDLLRRCFSAN